MKSPIMYFMEKYTYAVPRSTSHTKSGFVCYGIPVGTIEYVKQMLSEKVQEVKGEVNRVKEVLGEEDGQAMWSILKCSLAQKLCPSALPLTSLLQLLSWTVLSGTCWSMPPSSTHPRVRRGWK